MDSTARHPPNQNTDDPPAEVDSATIKRAIERAKAKNLNKRQDGRFPSEYTQLIIASIAVAFLLHKFLSRKRSGATGVGKVYVLGTASGENQVGDGNVPEAVGVADGIKPDQLATSNEMQINTFVKKEEIKGQTKNPRFQSGSLKSATKEAASSRNYDKLLSKVDELQLAESKEEIDIAPPLQKDTTENAPSYLNFNKFMSVPKQDVHLSETKEDTCQESKEEDHLQINPLTPNNETTIQLHSKAQHPGLTAFYQWKSTIMSLYRVYAIPLHSYPQTTNANKIQEAVLPMHPSSERGKTPLYIEVTNLTSHNVSVFWIDYKGNEVYKGSMRRGQSWTQTTYIGHPWTFRIDNSNNTEETVLLKYVPFRVIPSVAGAETVYQEYGVRGDSVGMHKFALKDVPEGYGVIVDGQKWRPACFVEDLILPEPPLVSLVGDNNVILSDVLAHEPEAATYNKLMNEIYTAMDWSCKQIQREEATSSGCGISAVKRLRQYISNISSHPDEPKYRKLRICNPIFMHNVYNTGARGVLLALGFEEHYGYMEAGAADGQMLTMDRITMMSDCASMLYSLLDSMESERDGNSGMQPMGADGFGRAGYGYAGSMNLAS